MAQSYEVHSKTYRSQFQGGSFDPWGGPGFENCAALINHEFARVFYKNNFAAGITLFNVYMVGSSNIYDISSLHIP